MLALRMAAAVVLLVGLTGCGDGGNDPAAAPSAPIDFLPGERVGALAEQQLEAEHLEMATGSVTCPDLDFEVGASVRCVKLSELSEGRRVKVPGTVSVTSTAGGGKLHVELDDRAVEFGVAGAYLAEQAKAWLEDSVDDVATVQCPYLAGSAGAEVVCTGTAGGEEISVRATATEVDPADYRTRFSFRIDEAASTPQASPTFVAGDGAP